MGGVIVGDTRTPAVGCAVALCTHITRVCEWQRGARVRVAAVLRVCEWQRGARILRVYGWQRGYNLKAGDWWALFPPIPSSSASVVSLIIAGVAHHR